MSDECPECGIRVCPECGTELHDEADEVGAVLASIRGALRHRHTPEATWHAALQAAMQAQRDYRYEHGSPDWDSDWDDEAEAMLEAAWPRIADYERAAERERWEAQLESARNLCTRGCLPPRQDGDDDE